MTRCRLADSVEGADGASNFRWRLSLFEIVHSNGRFLAYLRVFVVWTMSGKCQVSVELGVDSGCHPLLATA